MPVFLADEQDTPLSTDELIALAQLVLGSEGYDTDIEMTLMFVTDDDIAGYNERFMGSTGPTDVLAFPLEHLHPGTVPKRQVNGPPMNLGDVIVAPSYVTAQAHSGGVAPDDELALMVVHGTLHLLGYDHPDDKLAEIMEAREREILAKVGRTRP